MLTELRIANFAVIEQLTLEFADGFQVLTGETGAGKSILVDALALLIGGRASADQIRAEAEEAELQASFSIPAHSPLIAGLRDDGIVAPDE
ncbi:MAG: AAA family ATPase, partial [Nitrospirota bacterium]|nr:AAA family ATPase [Nitrospirota bacterium]